MGLLATAEQGEPTGKSHMLPAVGFDDWMLALHVLSAFA
jgi:hypothetical protein